MYDDELGEMLTELETRRGRMDRLAKGWAGESPSAFLTRKSRDAVDQRLQRLGVNHVRLGVRSIIDRLQVNGFTRGTSPEHDADTWALWERAGLVAGSELVHADRALYGAAYVTVWGHVRDPRRPVVMLDSPRTAYVETDPATGDVTRAVRKWRAAGREHALLMTPAGMTRYSAPRDTASTAVGAWRTESASPNPWGIVPCVPFIRRTSADDVHGTSYVADILDLSDAAAKILQDGVVTSEYFARPRRWATGLEVVEDEDGNPVDPFGESRFLQSEDPETKFGQLAPSGVDGYADLLATITQQIASLLGLPAHYVGLHGDQPPSGDSIRAAETQLTANSYSEQRHLTGPWAEVAGWLHAIRDGRDAPEDITTRWASPETRTAAQAADAAAKLHGMGVPLRPLLLDPLGYEPHEVEQIMQARTADATERAALDLTGLMP